MKNRKAFTVETDENLSERFSEQTLSRGYTKYRAIEGALRLWLTLSPTEQNFWIEGKVTKPEGEIPPDGEIYSDIRRLARLLQDIDAKIARSEQARLSDNSSLRSRKAE